VASSPVRRGRFRSAGASAPPASRPASRQEPSAVGGRRAAAAASRGARAAGGSFSAHGRLHCPTAAYNLDEYAFVRSCRALTGISAPNRLKPNIDGAFSIHEDAGNCVAGPLGAGCATSVPTRQVGMDDLHGKIGQLTDWISSRWRRKRSSICRRAGELRSVLPGVGRGAPGVVVSRPSPRP
jgi:hypothetical protein